MLDHYHTELFTPIMVHPLTVTDEDTSEDCNEGTQWQHLYNDIKKMSNASNAQQLYSDIKNSSNDSHGQQVFSDLKDASKAQQLYAQWQLLYSDIKNSSKQLQEKRLQKCHFVSALAIRLNLMNMIYVPFLTTQSSLMVENSDSQII